jgi:hypothetical protein
LSVLTYTYLYSIYSFPTIWPRTNYRSGWLRCDVFKCIGIPFKNSGVLVIFLCL